ncbi:Thioesterase FSL2 [Hyphodiscus hymeniophilus]|uniref:Thioesterase FSL2 n=1 Tax=Hyphodiscus hymeniophilus TaxID=353542 RepID=A0A9P6VN39_9HELO|nr:Thioesterase FSL2 [Hyphodiscus hymeniophilus]
MYPEEEYVTGDADSRPKPAILCLHGGGTNAMIFNIQTIRIQRVLGPYFEFVFVESPQEGAPGPDVIPVFEGMEPYRRWHFDHVKSAQTIATLQDAMDEQKRKDGRGFVGALGFSQGAMAVSGLLLEQQARERKEGGDDGTGLAFAVLFNGTYPPLTAGLTDEEQEERIRVPSLHVIGTEDPYRENGMTLFEEYFDPKTASMIEFKVGHRLPVLENDTAKVANEILRMYAEAEGKRQTDPEALAKFA